MRVTIDLEKEIIIIPDNFFKKISEDNERLEKFGAKPIPAVERIRNAFEKAMSDTDKRLITKHNATVSRPKSKKNSEDEE